jgi:RimJ/RimL family protein N-acetyltransferase
MIDARHFSKRILLRSGREAVLRALRPDDGERMAEAFSKLEEETIHTRFFGAKAGLDENDQRLIREMDFDTRVALVATLIEDGRELIIASGSYARFGKEAAEVAFTVEEDYHGQGIARRLLAHLAEIARERGVTRFEAEVLPHNAAMLRVFAASGWPMTRSFRDGVAHVTLSLKEAQSQEATGR